MEKLFNEFQPASYEQWLTEALETLKGKPLESLNGKTHEGINTKPIYFQEDDQNISLSVKSLPGLYPFLRGTSALCKKVKQWEIHKESNNFKTEPLFNLLTKGKADISFQDYFNNLRKEIAGQKTANRLININSTIFRESGGNCIHELGFSFSQGVQYIRELQKRGTDIDSVAQNIGFIFSAGSDFFMEISKFRASRVIWSRIIKEFGGNSESQKIHFLVKPLLLNKSILDPWNNMLRVTTETLSAILGGADGIFSQEHNILSLEKNSSSSRLAGNIQSVLGEECNLTDTLDPSGGSWYVESLTSELIAKSWELFISIEKKGGFLKSIFDGFPQSLIEKSAIELHEKAATRKMAILGVNKYPNPADKLMLNEFSKEEDNKFQNKQVQPLKMIRLSEPFETLRLNSECYKLKKGNYPQVHITKFGTPKQYKARSDFADEFFKIGGFEVIESEAKQKTDDAIRAFLDSGSNICVICTDDLSYNTIIPEFVPELKERNPEAIIILAGKPEGKTEEYSTAGIDEFIFLNCNVLNILNKLQKRIMGQIDEKS